MHEFIIVTPAGIVVAVGVHAGMKSSKSELVKIRRAKPLAIIEISKNVVALFDTFDETKIVKNREAYTLHGCLLKLRG